MDEILEGYRTFTALAAEVSTPGGSGIMSRYGTAPTSPPIRDATPQVRLSPPVGSGTLDDYAPLQQRQQESMARGVGNAVGATATATATVGGGGGAPLVARRGLRQDDGRRGKGVPYIDPASDPVVMDALRLLFAKEGNYVQDLVRFLECNPRGPAIGRVPPPYNTTVH